MAEIGRQGIAIDDDNDPEPENSPIQGETTAATGSGSREGIICPLEIRQPSKFFCFFQKLLP